MFADAFAPDKFSDFEIYLTAQIFRGYRVKLDANPGSGFELVFQVVVTLMPMIAEISVLTILHADEPPVFYLEIDSFGYDGKAKRSDGE